MRLAGPELPYGRGRGRAGIRQPWPPRGRRNAQAQSWLRRGPLRSPSSCCCRLPSPAYGSPWP
eukprot:11939391-Alexandrium_andersonii.AAC.1